LICQGEQRFTVLDYVSREPFPVARIEAHREATEFEGAAVREEIEARGMNLRDKAGEALGLLPQAPGELANAIRSIESIPALADMVASFMDLKVTDKQEILATFDLKARLDMVLAFLRRRIEVMKVSRQIDEKTREAFDERQKEAVLRERLHQIQKELGEADGTGGVEASGQGRRYAAGSRRTGSARAQSPPAHVGTGGRILHHAHLSRLAARHALGQARS
jgi:ATP-dependent Lon protease